MGVKVPNVIDKMDMRLIPLKPYTKEPRVKWGNDNNLTFNGSETSYGIDTGRSNLVVIDCDSKDDVNGVENFFLLAREYGGVPETLSVATPNGGLHFYFKAPESKTIKSSQSELAKAIDVRAWGGYVVGPGSIIKNNDGDETEYFIENDDFPILNLPDWLTDLLFKEETKSINSKTKKSNNTTNNKSNANSVIEQKTVYNWAINKMENATEGERQKILNNVSLFMGHARVPREMAKGVIDIAINTGLTFEEAERTFEHGYNDGANKDEYDFEQISINYNIEMENDVKFDPLNSAFYTHIALSHNFFNSYPDKFIYWTQTSTWYKYVDERGSWEEMKEQDLIELVDRFLDDLVTDIRKRNHNLPSNIYRLQEKLWLKNYINDVATICRNRYIKRDKKLFDSNDYQLNCKNGVVDLRDGSVSEHSKDNFITKYIPYNYIPGAKDIYSDKIIDSIAEDQRDYMQIMSGQSLLASQPASQVAIFLHGRGSNGKSTFLESLIKTGGSYCKLQPPGVLLSDKNGGDKYAMADFEGLRAAIIEELPNSKVLDIGALKRIVGTPLINARPIYGKNREFENTVTMFVSCNRLPIINESDHASWRRVVVVNFPYTYKSKKEDLKGVNDKLADSRVLYSANRSIKTAEAFLAWRIEGAINVYNNPDLELNVPESIIRTVHDWNENNDLMLSWFNENFTVEQGVYITLDDLWMSYNEFLISRGNSKVSLRFFLEQFTNHTIYHDNKLVYRKSAYILQELTRSCFSPENTELYKVKATPLKASHVIGLRFK